MKKNRILIATTNKWKIIELKELLHGYDLFSLSDYKDDVPEPDEPYATFKENAAHKARHYAKLTGEISLSDDSGLCVNALDGFPGVISKRFLDECGSQESAFKKLQEMLAGNENTSVSFVCSAAVCFPENGNTIIGDGILEGNLFFQDSYVSGCGYDPIIVPNGYDRNMAELGIKVKNQIGHRAKAIQDLLKKLGTYI